MALPILQDNIPGYDWLKSFMGRYNLSFKLPSTLEKTRKAASSNPDLIYGFYDLIENRAKEIGIEDRPECIWNVDETNLCIEAQNAKVSYSIAS